MNARTKEEEYLRRMKALGYEPSRRAGTKIIKSGLPTKAGLRQTARRRSPAATIWVI